MLKQRIFTALLLLAVLLPAVFCPMTVVFATVALLLISAAAWEWSNLNQGSPAAALVGAAVCGGLCVASWASGLLNFSLQMLWVVTGCAWVVFGAWLLRGGVGAWTRLPRWLRLAGGLCALWVAWMAVVSARNRGINFLFSVLVLVWAADVFAYFAGRTFGGRLFKRKLAPSISPGKTWEGVVGGMVGVVLIAFGWRFCDLQQGSVDVSIFSLLGKVHPLFMLLAVVFMAMMSVVGDLVESLFKRSAGVKDSSALLPGHGGVLDRIDALLPILPLAMMLSRS